MYTYIRGMSKLARGAGTIFKDRDVVYILIGIISVDEDEYEEKQLYIGTNYDRSRSLPQDSNTNEAFVNNVDFSDYYQYRHRTYVDNELMFESVFEYHSSAWNSTYDLLDELEAEVEAAKQKLAEATGKLLALGQL
jgi:hypothetical protein